MSALSLSSVGFIRGGKNILEQISWSVPVGGCAAILGGNGSGKSTLLRILAGYEFPSLGEVHVLGEEIGRTDVHELRRRIGVVDPAGPYTPSDLLSAEEVVLSGFWGKLTTWFDDPTSAQIDKAGELLTSVGLAGKEKQAFGTMSMGERRRALLARALVHPVELLMLDEPTAGLDLLARETLLETIQKLKQDQPTLTILLVTHHLEEILPETSEILLLSEGRVSASGQPQKVLLPEILSQAFKCQVFVIEEHGRWAWRVAKSSHRLFGNSENQGSR